MLIINRGWNENFDGAKIKVGKAALDHDHVNGLMMETCPQGLMHRGGDQFIKDVLAAGKYPMFLMPPGPPLLRIDGKTYLQNVKEMMASIEASGVDLSNPQIVFALAVYSLNDTPQLSGFIDGVAPLTDALEFMKEHPMHSK